MRGLSREPGTARLARGWAAMTLRSSAPPTPPSPAPGEGRPMARPQVAAGRCAS
jgi:hypothetical protein